jgi:hypothetical protein
MTLQFAITLVLAILGALYLLKGILPSFLTGGCKSGCGSCASGGCPVKKLEAIQKPPLEGHLK